LIRGVLEAAGIRRVLSVARPSDGQEGEAPARAVPELGSLEGISLPGDLELHTLCANARRVAGFCDLAGIPDPQVATYDPDPPYIWDVD
jgi:hypothetical protein